MEDNSLAARAADGDEAAFELLVRRHTEGVWRLARSILRDDFEAEEAVQDTFLKAHRALASFRGEAAFRTWLLAICHRTCLDRLRLRRAAVVPLALVRERCAEEDMPDIRLALEQILNGLSEDERRAFVLVHVLAFSREEAARICEVPASTMRSRVARARERLAALIEAGEAAEEDA